MSFSDLYSKSDMTAILILTSAFRSSIPYYGISLYSKNETTHAVLQGQSGQILAKKAKIFSIFAIDKKTRLFYYRDSADVSADVKLSESTFSRVTSYPFSPRCRCLSRLKM
jgi:hypothetical protein